MIDPLVTNPSAREVIDTVNEVIEALGGIATLDVDGRLVQNINAAGIVGTIDAGNLPSYVDDVLEYANLAAFPVTGETGKIYLAQDTGASYRWTGTVYLKLSDDDVLEFANLAAFPASGAGAALYIAADTGLLYRWDGAAYATVGGGGGGGPVAQVDATVRGTVVIDAGTTSLDFTGAYSSTKTIDCVNIADGATVAIHSINGIGTVTLSGTGLTFTGSLTPFNAGQVGSLTRNGNVVHVAGLESVLNKVQEIESTGDFSAGQIKYPSLLATRTAVNTSLAVGDVFDQFILSGLDLTMTGGLDTTLSAGVAYIGGEDNGVKFIPVGRIVRTADNLRTHATFRDTYVDLTNLGYGLSQLNYTTTANGNPPPPQALASLRLWKIVTNGTDVTSIERLAPTQPTFKTPVTVPDAVAAGDAINKGQLDAAVGLQPVASMTMLGNNTGGSAVPTALAKTEVQTLLDIGWLLQSRSVAAPNATVPAHKLSPIGAEANIDVVLSPKGTGAIIAQVPDNLVAGGNKRGTYAVDLQMHRAFNAQVASGADSLIGAGANNTASGSYATVINGSTCTAGGQYALAGGESCAASASYAVSLGSSNSVAGSSGVAIGYGHNIGAIATGAAAFGRLHRLDGRGSSAFGIGARDFNMSGLHLIAGENGGSEAGYRQVARSVLRLSTTDATTKAITQDGDFVSNVNVFKYPSPTQTYVIKARITARKSAATVQVKVWEATIVLGDATGAGDLAILYNTITVLYESAGATGWTIDANLDTANDRFYFNATGAAATTIGWVADVDILFGSTGV